LKHWIQSHNELQLDCANGEAHWGAAAADAGAAAGAAVAAGRKVGVLLQLCGFSMCRPVDLLCCCGLFMCFVHLEVKPA
jgi:hypothetical protein